MKVFRYEAGAGPRSWGQAHGETFRGMIRELAEIRIGLCLSIGRFRNRDELISVASGHLPVLQSFDRDLEAELLGIAEGAALSEEELLILNHYTDIRDIDPGGLGPSMGRPTSPVRTVLPDTLKRGNEEGCSVVYAQGSSTRLLGQTWDMHGTAEPYVMMLGVPEHLAADGTRRPAHWVFTLTGCVALAGLNSAGLAVTINNLRSVDAGVGVVWPVFVRRLLAESGIKNAKEVALTAPIGSGHHYLVAARDGVFGLETSGALKEMAYSGEKDVFVHTNHALCHPVSERTVVVETSSSHERYRRLAPLEEGWNPSLMGLWEQLGSHDGYPRSVCSHLSGPNNPHGSRTCGGISMDLQASRLLAAQGCLFHAQPQLFAFDGPALKRAEDKTI